MSLNVLLLTKQVPDFSEGMVKFKPDNTLDRASTPSTMNPNDKIAQRAALEAKVKYGATLRVMSMGPPEAEKTMREAMSMYADELYLLSDRLMRAADTLATAYTLSKAILKLGRIDLIFAGFKTQDGETGQTGPQTAWMLGIPLITHVVGYRLDTERRIIRAKRLVNGKIIEAVESPFPALLTIEAKPPYEPEYRSARERLVLKKLLAEGKRRASNVKDYLKVWSAAELDADLAKMGLDGSPTVVLKVEPIPQVKAERNCKILDGTNLEDLDQIARFIVDRLRTNKIL